MTSLISDISTKIIHRIRCSQWDNSRNTFTLFYISLTYLYWRFEACWALSSPASSLVSSKVSLNLQYLWDYGQQRAACVGSVFLFVLSLFSSTATDTSHLWSHFCFLKSVNSKVHLKKIKPQDFLRFNVEHSRHNSVSQVFSGIPLWATNLMTPIIFCLPSSSSRLIRW